MAPTVPGYVADWVLERGIYEENAFILMIRLLFLVLIVAAIFARGKRLNLVLLIALVSLYPIGGIEGVLRG